LRRIVEDEHLVHRDVQKLRSVDEKRGTFERYIFPTLGSCPIADIKRSEIVKMLDRVHATKGHGAANNAFRVLRAFLAWHAGRDDDFRSPMTRGMFKPEAGPGARTLTDDELRIMWKVASEGRNAYDHFLRFTLLTAARRRETANMQHSELSPDGSEWTIPAARYKSKHAHLIPLSALAREVLDAVPVLGDRWVFTTSGATPISGFSKFKLAFDKRLKGVLEQEDGVVRERIIADLRARYPGSEHEAFGDGWSVHSLRKTARTLLSRVGIDTATAEKCLGHADVKLVQAYDHHEFAHEKRTAFEALAREVERIATGVDAEVVPFTRRN
jgi:integrase